MACTNPPRLRRDDSVLLVVDVQEKLVPALHEPERLVRNCVTLVKAARVLNVPVVVTEQNPARLGPTVEPLREALGTHEAWPKMRFSSLVPETKSQLEVLGKRTVLLCGAETHVCVLQTALDLLENGYTVVLARDAVSSRSPFNIQTGFDRMSCAGVVPTSTESSLFEWLEEAGTDQFRALLPLIK